MSIIRSRLPFDDNFIPPEIVDRTEEQTVLKTHFEPIISGDVQPINLHVIGSIGSGKTVTTRVILQNLPAKPCYIQVDEWIRAKTYKMVCDLLSFFGLKIYGNVCDSLYNIKAVAGDRPFIVVIDEADNMSTEDLDPILHFLSRETYATTVIISRRPNILDGLREDTRDSFKYREIVFKSYRKAELFEILKQRAEMGLKPGSYTDEVLYRIAEEAEPYGSARYALDLLLEMAELSGSRPLKEDYIPVAIGYVEKRSLVRALQSLPTYHALLLTAVYDLCRNHPKDITLAKVYERFNTVCTERGLRPLSKRRLYDLLSDLKIRGYIDITRHGKGRGRGTECYVEMQDYTKEAIDSLQK
jgi:cell division control protein 6